MARERPFKDELKDVHKAVRNSADCEHLQRWEDDFRAQEIWDRFKEHNPNASPNELIKPVLKMRREARAWVARISQTSDWPKDLHRLYARRAAEVFARHESLWDAAAQIGILFYEMLETAETVELWRGDMLSGMPPHISRQKKTQRDDNWAIHKLCIIKISNFWQRQCGRPADAEVAALTEIAFPDVEITAEQVRTVRRSTGEVGMWKTPRLHH
jgi:hypothetical protein